MQSSISSRKQAFHNSTLSNILLLFGLGLYLLFPCKSFADRSFTGPLAPEARESLPSRLFPDGWVCMVDERRSSVCAKRLVKVDPKVTKAHSRAFCGVFDLNADGLPEIFLDYWSPYTWVNMPCAAATARS